MQSGFDPDPRTLRIINKMLDKGNLVEDQPTLEAAFYDYVFFAFISV